MVSWGLRLLGLDSGVTIGLDSGGTDAHLSLATTLVTILSLSLLSCMCFLNSTDAGDPSEGENVMRSNIKKKQNQAKKNGEFFNGLILTSTPFSNETIKVAKKRDY